MTCENCYYYDVCAALFAKRLQSMTINNLDICDKFKNKATIVELPAALGTNVWCVANECGRCEYCETVPPDSEKGIAEYIEACQSCDRFEIIECKLDYELIPEMGKMAFLTKEEAEKRLEELRNG